MLTNEERLQRLERVATAALNLAWPDKVSVIPIVGRPHHFLVTLEINTPHGPDHRMENVHCSTEELFRLVAGIVDDYRPDRHWVFDTVNVEVKEVDALDYKVEELASRFVPLAKPFSDEHWELRKSEAHTVALLLNKGGRIIETQYLDEYLPKKKQEQQDGAHHG